MKTPHLSIIVVFLTVIFTILTMTAIKNVSGLLVAETPLQTYNSADLILVGKVTSVEKMSDIFIQYQYNVQVEEYVKNKQTNSTISVIASGSSIPSPPKFEVGQRVLFLLDKEDGNYVVSPNSFLAPDGCTSHQMLGLRAFPNEPISDELVQGKFEVDKSCLDPLIEPIPSSDVYFSPYVQLKAGTEPKDVACSTDLILVFHPDNGFPACVKPDTANILVTRGWNQSPINKITIDGLDPVYYVGEKINFKINFKGFVSSCDYPHMSIVDSNQNMIWKGNSLALMCDPQMSGSIVYINQTYQLSEGLGGPVAINQTGDYTTKVSWYDQKLDTGFTVISSH
jgi:hypothetical protein